MNFAPEMFLYNLRYLLTGMVGIFLVIVVIILAVTVMNGIKKH